MLNTIMWTCLITNFTQIWNKKERTEIVSEARVWLHRVSRKSKPPKKFGWSGDRIPVAARFSAPVQTGPRAHPASYTVGTGSFQGVKRLGRGVYHPPHLAPRLRKQKIYIPLLPLWAFVACYRKNFTFTFTELHPNRSRNTNSIYIYIYVYAHSRP